MEQVRLEEDNFTKDDFANDLIIFGKEIEDKGGAFIELGEQLHRIDDPEVLKQAKQEMLKAFEEHVLYFKTLARSLNSTRDDMKHMIDLFIKRKCL